MDNLWRSDDWAFQPFPIEQEIAAEYAIEWQGGIDWFNDYTLEIVDERLVFLARGKWRPETDGDPFDQIMERLGGMGYHDGNVYGDITAQISFDPTCDAPDEATAIGIYDRNFGFDQLILRDGTHLVFQQWQLNDFVWFSDMLDDLKQRGCTNIQYTFSQVDFSVP